ncbi:MAG: YfhO family protein [Bacteroidales bacterium]|jgi:uncharacterized membrane protein YfhO
MDTKNKITQNKNESDFVNTIDNIFKKHGIYILISLIAIAVFIVFKDFILFKKLYLFKDIGSDSINYSYPQCIHISDYIRNTGIPKWSFNQGMGQNIFPFSFTDPFNALLFILGRNNIGYGIIYKEILKIFLAGIFFYLFLKKLSLSEYPAIIGGISYSFSSFIILGGCWDIFSTEAVYLAFLLFSFEKLYQENKWFLFPIAISLIAILQPFDLYLYGLFLIIYIVFRYLEDSERRHENIFVLLLKITGLGLLGILMSSFFFINELIQMMDSSRVSGDNSYFKLLISKSIFGFEDNKHNITAIMRLFSSDLLGTGSNFKGWYNYLEAPLFYCGLINLLLIPQLFIFIDKRKKIIYSILLAGIIIPVIFPFFRYTYWLYTGDYYRAYSLLVVAVLLFFSIKSLNYIIKNPKIDFKILVITLVVILIILCYPYEYLQNNKNLNENLRNTVVVFLMIYTISIFLLQFKKAKNIIQLLLLLFILTELSFFSSIIVKDRPVITGAENKEKTGYNDYTNDAVTYLNTVDKSFYRINKDYFSGPVIDYSYSANEAKIQNFKSTPSYHSFNQTNYIKFLVEMNIVDGRDERLTRCHRGLTNNHILHGFASIKYSLSKTLKPFVLNYGYDSIASFGYVSIYKNKYFLPLGFCYNSYITDKNFKKLSVQQKGIVLYKAFVIKEKDTINMNAFQKFNLKDTAKFYSWQDYGNDIANLKKDTLAISEYSQNNIKGKISLSKKQMLFFSIPFDKGWSVSIDGNTVKPVTTNIGFTGLIVDKGNHIVELSFTPLYFHLSRIISLIAIALFISLVFIKHARRQKHS